MTNTSAAYPLVTVGIAAYNEARFIREALDSLVAQEYPGLEVFISDNASTDGTYEICREFAARDARITVVRQSENKGMYLNGWNIVNNVRGRYCMFPGAHDVVLPGFIPRAVELLDRDPETVLVYSRSTRIDANGTVIGPGKNKFDLRGISAAERLRRLIWEISGGDPYFGLFRTSDLMSVLRSTGSPRIWGNDQAGLAAICLKGAIAHIPESFFLWRVISDESCEHRAKRFMARFDPEHAEDGARKTLQEHWGDLAAFHLELVAKSDLDEFDKQTLKMEIVRCFKTRYNAMWGAPPAPAAS